MTKPASLTISTLSLILFASCQDASAVVIAGYNLSAGNVINPNSEVLANPTSALNTATVQPGATPSSMTIVGAGANLSISMSSTTASAYMQGSYTPTSDLIFTGSRYFTFNVNLSSAFNLSSLTFDMAATTNAAAAITFGAQIDTGSGFTNLSTSTINIPGSTGTTTNFGVYSADLSTYQNLTGIVTFRLFIADNSSDNGVSGRIRNVQLNASPIPEPSGALAFSVGLASLTLLRRRGR